MGIWDFYFIAKLLFYFGHFTGFHVFENLAFAICLLIPLQHPRLKLARQALAIPVGVALFYYDSWLPPVSRLLTMAPQISQFDLAYLGELLGRLINLPLIAALVLLYIAYFFARKKFRISTFVLIAMLLPLLPITGKSPDAPPPATASNPAPSLTSTAVEHTQPTDTELTAALNTFYQRESTRSVTFTPPAKSDPAFDIIFLHICSLSRDDLKFTREQDNPLFKRFDIVFSNFNSAASYSGPAVIRLLRGSCGQPKHSVLYDPSAAACQTFNNLQQAGFEQQFAMNHDGHYGDFIADVRKRGGMQAKLFDVQGAPPYLQSFDGTPVHDDYTVLSQWWNRRMQMPAERVALYYNSISLHDGNRYSGRRTTSSLEIYHPRMTRMLADIDQFLGTLQKSGRRAVVVFIPEHGAAVRGDKMQIAGLREIPSPHITIVPVGIKLIGMSSKAAASPLLVPRPVSYLALSQLLSDFISFTPFGNNSLGLDEYLRDLPATEFVAENEDVVVMQHGAQYFIRAQDAGWVEYDPSE